VPDEDEVPPVVWGAELPVEGAEAVAVEEEFALFWCEDVPLDDDEVPPVECGAELPVEREDAEGVEAVVVEERFALSW
jgi:hypothetical protein